MTPKKGQTVPKMSKPKSKPETEQEFLKSLVKRYPSVKDEKISSKLLALSEVKDSEQWATKFLGILNSASR